MNAETHSFASEISKRCLMLYTDASVPDEPRLTRALNKSTHAIRNRLGTALYQAFLAQLMHRLENESWEHLDLLYLSTRTLHNLIAEHTPRAPAWCVPIRMDDYQGRKYEKVRMDLLKLFETNRKVWKIRREEVVLSIDYVHDAKALAKEIPDHILADGTKAGNIMLRRPQLEEFLGCRLGSRFTWLIGR